MSFSKAQDLIRLAQLAAARRQGISLDEIAEEFDISHRTAQRMTDALEATFAHVQTTDGADRRRIWHIADPGLDRLQLRADTAVEALEIAAHAAEGEGRIRHAKALSDLRDQALARLPRKEALRTEADADAVLSALTRVTRPGPRVTLAPAVLDAIIEALRGPLRLRVMYRGETTPRILDPHGVLLGHRTYLVARQTDRDPMIRNFRMDLISEAEALDESFALAEGFDLSAYAARAFGVWQDPAQYAEVVWRFAPDAAERAAGFSFHPAQRLELQPDGSLLVRFHAAGWVEMAWHLYQWGDRVEVLAPEGLRRLMADLPRPHFDAMP